VVASPQGGATVLDPISITLWKDDQYLQNFAKTQQKLWMETEKLESFLGRAKEFTAIFYVGGFGRKLTHPSSRELANQDPAMFDLVDNEVSIQLIREFYESDRIVTAVCHGSAALLNATLSDGTRLIDGERVTGFSGQEEIDVDRQKDMPFHLENALNEKSGGNYEKAPAAWVPHVIVSSTKKLLTGQNPASAGPLSEALWKYIESH
jgi:putative intracellular protease/amidase